jgi:peptidoglycan/LPS O-acetylase OafA/YrhL
MGIDGALSRLFSRRPEGAKRFAYIDALRGYAILGVLLTHSALRAGIEGGLPSVGARGVQLFFIVSAITLMLSWHERNDGAGPFFVRRAFRILPMFWLSIPLYLSTTSDVHQTIGAAFLLQGMRPEWIFGPTVPGGWSVSAEAVFYCFFPLLVARITSLSRALWLIAASLLISRLWRTMGLDALPTIFPNATPGELWGFVYFSFPAQLPAFAAGMAGYFLLSKFAQLSRWTLETILLGTFAGIAWFAAYKQENIAAFAALFAICAACIANGLEGGVVTGSGNGVCFDNSGSQAPVSSSGMLTPSGSIQSLNGGISQTAMKTMPPTIVVPYLVRVI